ncbi:DNA polymerase iota isoform X2 [Schistocerca serialis cubense]|uniref:DNA polymerase iota isoform X2 n=1 Tax=Schistocerca serialis cubense TaxID=2023355 RepID=UPI00214F2FED|nr:DNA polymerase iota isoform X2 [Schistocerca serialis cubense]
MESPTKKVTVMDDFGQPLELGTQNDHRRTIIHIDIDCFYAQVEILKNPSLKDLPVGIQQKNIVVTCNYIAREYGVKKCMEVREAQSLCPQLVLVCGEDLHDYRQMSSKVTNLLQNFSTQVERLGLDENFVDVSHLVSQSDFKTERAAADGKIFKNIMDECDCGCHERLCIGSHIASKIRKQIKSDLGLTCCAGISYNKLLSKLVCSVNKPDQQTTVFACCALDLVSGLPGLRCIPGIGSRLCETLQSVDITSISDLQNCSMEKLRRAVGVDNAIRLKRLSFGIDNLPVKQSGKPHTISLEDGCRKVNLESEVRSKFSVLLQRLMVLLNEDGRIPCAVKVTVRKYDSVTKVSHRESKQCNIPPSFFTTANCEQLSSDVTEKLTSSVMQLFHKMVNISKPFHLTLVGVGFTKFQERKTGKSSIASFLKKDLSVQSVTSYKYLSGIGNGMEQSPSQPFPVHRCFHNTEKSGSESEPEPSPKKTRIDSWVARRKRTVCMDDDSDDASPSKLRVSDIHLNSSDSVEETSSEELPHNKMEKKLDSDYLHSVCTLEDDCVQATKRDFPVECKCPDGVDQSVFRELPYEMQMELVESWNYKAKTKELKSNVKGNKNTILHYFIRDKQAS